MTTHLPEEAQRRAAFTYNAAADSYDSSPLSFWNYFGGRTVELLSPLPGSNLLDVCCGTGVSALSAARLVGPRGKVIGVDLAKELLELARTKAARQHFGNIQFELGDMLSLRFPSESFDVVVSVFGIFFVPDMEKAVRELWRLVRRGGQLAVTTWVQIHLNRGTPHFGVRLRMCGLSCTKALIRGIESTIRKIWRRF